MRKTFQCGQGVIIKVVFSMCGRHSMAIEYSRKTDNLLVSLSLKGSHVRMLTFSYRSCAVCTIVSYITAIYRESIALAYRIQGLPYIPRVHLSEGSLVRSPLKRLCSEEPMVRRSFIPKFLYSESCYVPKIPYSERPSTIWILCYEDS